MPILLHARHNEPACSFRCRWSKPIARFLSGRRQYEFTTLEFRKIRPGTSSTSLLMILRHKAHSNIFTFLHNGVSQRRILPHCSLTLELSGKIDVERICHTLGTWRSYFTSLQSGDSGLLLNDWPLGNPLYTAQEICLVFALIPRLRINSTNVDTFAQPPCCCACLAYVSFVTLRTLPPRCRDV